MLKKFGLVSQMRARIGVSYGADRAGTV